MSQPAEEYVDAVELGRRMGISARTVMRWRKLGMPSETWGMARTRRYLTSKCMAWARTQKPGSLSHEPAVRMTTARPDHEGAPHA